MMMSHNHRKGRSRLAPSDSGGEDEAVGNSANEAEEIQALLLMEAKGVEKKLVRNARNGTKTGSSLWSSSWLRLAAGGASVAAVALLYLLSSSFSKKNGPYRQIPKARLDATQTLRMLEVRFRAERSRLEDKLRVEYGEYYDAMFTRTLDATNPAVTFLKNRNKKSNQTVEMKKYAEGEKDGRSTTNENISATDKKVTVSVGRVILQSPTLRQEWGPRRMRNLMIRKLLQVLVSSGGNDNEDRTAVTFVWATGGHSSSAGHGNLHNESYTAVLERAASDAFKSVGIRFEGRNRAMGGTNSYPEIALCGQEVFGLDIDVLSWDYAMMEVDEFFGQLQYYYRTVSHPNRPAAVAIPRARSDLTAGDTRVNGRYVAMRELERRGMASLVFDHNEYLSTVQAIPDTMEVLQNGQAAVDAMPPMLRYFNCEGSLETGDLCAAAKYTKAESCSERKKQVSWHEGYKWHHMMGSMYALGLVEFLSDAIDELLDRASDESLPPMDPAEMLSELRAVQDEEYKRFLDAALPDMAKDMLVKFPPSKEGGYELEQLYIKQLYCHIALVPSQYRYLGTLTDTKTRLGQDNYEQGISLQHIMERPADLYPRGEAGLVSEFMQLTYDEEERENCDYTTYIDYKDFFLIRQRDGWKKVVIPTDSAIKAYPHRDASQLEGRLAFCTTPWATDEERDIHLASSASFADGLFALRVNGVDVTAVDKIRHCYVLRHGVGGSAAVFDPDAKGRFEIQAKVIHKDYVMKFTSFIVW